MRARLTVLLVCTLGALALPAGRAHAQPVERVEVRGVYYREPSTRVVEPMIRVDKVLPDGWDVNAHGLLDVITSASIAATGPARDEAFTEWRRQGGLGAGHRWGDTRVGGSFRVSREPDYDSNTFALSFSRRFWEKTGELSLTGSYSADRVVVRAADLDVYYGGIAYTQVLSPTWLAQIIYDVSYFKGYLQNPYLRVPNLGPEKPPEPRVRHALAARLAHYWVRAGLGFQLHYRFYYDHSDGLMSEPGKPVGNPWGLTAHTVEGRLYIPFKRDFELRLSYRYSNQGAAAFWCETDPSRGGGPGCYGSFPRFYSVDPKFGALSTHLPEIKFIWDLRVFRQVPILSIFSEGTADISYGQFIQDTRYGNAHLLAVGYMYPL